jgi:hypothetical protein
MSKKKERLMCANQINEKLQQEPFWLTKAFVHDICRFRDGLFLCFAGWTLSNNKSKLTVLN